jgi:hypothetical protein
MRQHLHQQLYHRQKKEEVGRLVQSLDKLDKVIEVEIFIFRGLCLKFDQGFDSKAFQQAALIPLHSMDSERWSS